MDSCFSCWAWLAIPAPWGSAMTESLLGAVPPWLGCSPALGLGSVAAAGPWHGTTRQALRWGRGRLVGRETA